MVEKTGQQRKLDGGALGAAASIFGALKGRLALRVLLPILGGYILTTRLAGLLGVLLTATIMTSSEAVLLSSMLAFPIYLGILIWGFGESRIGILLGVFGIGAGAAHFLSVLSTHLIA